MKRAILGVVVLFLVAGCGPMVCKDRSGTYTMSTTRRTGDCGNLGETVVQVGGGGSGSCSGGSTASEDNCEITVNTTCKDAEGSLTSRGKVTWNADGTEGSGVLELVFTGADACQGTYDVRYRKL
jgi:hypothetical protein